MYVNNEFMVDYAVGLNCCFLYILEQYIA